MQYQLEKTTLGRYAVESANSVDEGGLVQCTIGYAMKIKEIKVPKNGNIITPSFFIRNNSKNFK